MHAFINIKVGNKEPFTYGANSVAFRLDNGISGVEPTNGLRPSIDIVLNYVFNRILASHGVDTYTFRVD